MTHRVLAIRPAPDGAGKVLATFDVEIGDHLRIYNLQLRQSPAGLRTIAPNACGKHAATFHPVLAEQITKAAEAALGSHTADARIARTAA
ncbi:hypothetical protein [Mesorhizobium sp. CAU 1732]|uniref:hypothetical protein n=1 Tax=Mesorhizobium sp. CAU 1732 TaxID=3140358 RepID=UPI003261C313